MSTSLLQEWCAARLSSLCLVSERMAALAGSLMREEEAAIQAGVRLEALIIDNVCSRHQLTLALMVRELSASADSWLTGHATSRVSVTDLELEQAENPMLRSLSVLCDLRATMAAVQFSCEELAGVFGVLGLSNCMDDLYWMRDEYAAHNRRLATLVTSYQAQLLAPSTYFQQVLDDPKNPLIRRCVAGQMARLCAATDKTVQEAC